MARESDAAARLRVTRRRCARMLAYARARIVALENKAYREGFDQGFAHGLTVSRQEAGRETPVLIGGRPFGFEDLLRADDRGVQCVLREMEKSDLALALKTAETALREKIFKNLSERAATIVKEEMVYMGPVRRVDVEAAPRRMVEVAARLAKSGEAVVAERDGERAE